MPWVQSHLYIFDNSFSPFRLIHSKKTFERNGFSGVLREWLLEASGCWSGRWRKPWTEKPTRHLSFSAKLWILDFEEKKRPVLTQRNMGRLGKQHWHQISDLEMWVGDCMREWMREQKPEVKTSTCELPMLAYKMAETLQNHRVVGFKIPKMILKRHQVLTQNPIELRRTRGTKHVQSSVSLRWWPTPTRRSSSPRNNAYIKAFQTRCVHTSR